MLYIYIYQRWQRQVSFWDIKVATAKRGGKPPPESAARILDSQALTFLKKSPGKQNLLITDGAPCYPGLSHKFGWRHEACSHSKGLFCVKKRISNKRILIHTGGVDAMWRLSKSAIPCSLSTRSNGHVNPKLMRSIRVWQWRWMNSKTKSLMEVTGQALKDRVAMWVRKKTRRVFSNKFPVIYRLSSKKHFKIPGNFESILGHESVVSLWRKRHFFTKPSKRWRGFPPGG